MHVCLAWNYWIEFYFIFSADNPSGFGGSQHFDRPQQGVQNLGFRPVQKPIGHRLGNVRAEDEGRETD